MKVHEKVSAYLEKHNIRRNIVAQEAGIPLCELEAMLSGTQTMYADDLAAICHALNVSSTVFVEYKPA